MSKSVIALLVVVGFIVVSIIGVLSVSIDTNNNCVQFEQGIIAQFDKNRNEYDNGWKKVMEIAQIPVNYTEDFKQVYGTSLKARYGEKGSQAAMQWIKEQNPNIDADIYKQVGQTIKAFRNDFAENQNMLVEKKRVYIAYTKQFPRNVITSVLGYPKIDLNKYDIVTSTETEKAFETKKAGALKLR